MQERSAVFTSFQVDFKSKLIKTEDSASSRNLIISTFLEIQFNRTFHFQQLLEGALLSKESADFILHVRSLNCVKNSLFYIQSTFKLNNLQQFPGSQFHIEKSNKRETDAPVFLVCNKLQSFITRVKFYIGIKFSKIYDMGLYICTYMYILKKCNVAQWNIALWNILVSW